MTNDCAPHRVFKISELTRLIAEQLVPDNQRSAVSLACTCRYLEKPVLSKLWETQDSFSALLKVLPRDTWDSNDVALTQSVVRDPNFPSEESNA